MAFLEERFPTAIRYGSGFADPHTTQITMTAGGNRYARLVHPYPILELRAVLDSYEHAELLQDVLDLYHRAGGQAGGFRVRHFSDYSTNAYISAPTATDQLLVEGDTGEWQLMRWYGSDADPAATRRIIRKPVDGTVLVSAQGVTLDASMYAVDNTTGIVTWTADVQETITDITEAAQAVVTVGAHTYTAGMSVYFSGVVGMTEINGLRGEIVSVTGTTITVDIDTTGFTAYTSGGLTNSQPQSGEEIKGGCEFDIPMAFDDDLREMVYANYNAMDITVPLVEILNPEDA